MRIPSNVRVLLALLLAVVLVASACGDSESDVVAPGDDEESADEPEADPPADTEADTGEDTSTDDTDTDTDDDMEEGTDDPSLGGDIDDYCVLSAEQTRNDDSIDLRLSSPEELEAYFTESQQRLREAIGVAPDDIRKDLQLTLEQVEALSGVLSANNWDVFASIDELDAVTDDGEMDAVEARLEAFDLEVCGIEPDAAVPDDESSADDPFGSPEAFEAILGSEFGRQAFAEGMAETGDIDIEQATCLIDNLDFETLFLLGVGEGEPSAEDTSSLFAAFDACGITPDQLLG